MKTIYFVITLLMVTSELLGQDLIVTYPNDSINCKILNHNNKFHVEFVQLKYSKIDSGRYNLSKVKSIINNFYGIDSNTFKQQVSSNNLNPLKLDSQVVCFDTIITKENDTIVCKIIEDKIDWYVNYIVSNNSKQTIAYYKILMLKKCIRSNNFKQAVKENYLSNALKNKRVRVGFNYLFGYRIYLIPDGINGIQRDVLNKLRINHGFNGEFHIAVDKNKRVLLGANYSNLSANSSIDNVLLTIIQGSSAVPPGTTFFGTLNNTVNIQTFGPNCIIKFNDKPSIHNFAVQIGLNFNLYNDILSIGSYRLSTQGYGSSTFYNFLYEFKYTSNFSFFGTGGLDLSSITNIEVNDNGVKNSYTLTNEDRINTSKLLLGIGVNLNF